MSVVVNKVTIHLVQSVLLIGKSRIKVNKRSVYPGEVEKRLCQLTIFTARRSYASAVLGVVILSVRPSVHLSVTRVLCD